MRTREDVLRSMRRYVAACMAAGAKAEESKWRVRLEGDASFRRPFALVSSPVRSSVQPMGSAAARETMPIQVRLFPEQPPAGPGTGTAARLWAERAAARLELRLMVGAPDQADPDVRGYAGRIPLWDYTDADGEPLALEGPESVATRRTPRDFLELMDGWSVHVQPEGPDAQLFVGIADLRVRWWRATRPTAALVVGGDGLPVPEQPGGTVLEEVYVDTEAARPGS